MYRSGIATDVLRSDIDDAKISRDEMIKAVKRIEAFTVSQ